MSEPQISSSFVEGASPEQSNAVNVSELVQQHQPEQEKPRRRKRVRDWQGNLVYPEDLGKPGSASGTAQAESASVASPIPAIAKEQIESAVKSLIRVVDERVQFAVKNACKVVSDDREFRDGMVDQVKIGETELNTMASLTVVICEKYNFLGLYAAEILLAVSVLGYSYRVYAVLRELKALKEEHGISAQTAKVADNRT